MGRISRNDSAWHIKITVAEQEPPVLISGTAPGLVNAMGGVFGRTVSRSAITNAIFGAKTALPTYTEHAPHISETRCLGVVRKDGEKVDLA